MDMRIDYLDWDDVGCHVLTMIEKMQKDRWIPSVVVGITRGGLLPATMISHYLNIPMCSLDVSFRDNLGPFGGQTSTWIPEEIKNGHRILVVDDINDTGRTFEWIRHDWLSTVSLQPPVGENWPWNHIKFAAIVHNIPSCAPIDYFAVEIDKSRDPCWINFPWEGWYQELL
jgi:uncharacterized protein